MKKFVLIFIFAVYSSIVFSQGTIEPFAPLNDSVPHFFKFVEQNDLYAMNNDTLTLNILYVKQPYFREDSTWGVVNSDIYITYDDYTFVEKEEFSKIALYYLRDFKNQKPTRFVLCSENEMKSILKNAQVDGEPYYFFQPEKFVVIADTEPNNRKYTLKRVSVPKYMTLKIK